MKNKSTFKALLALSIIGMFSFAHKNTCAIRNVYGFYTISIAGNIAVDMDGKPLQSPTNVSYTIYVETNNKDLTWDSLKIGNLQYPVSSSIIESTSPLAIGKIKNMQKQYTIIPTKGNHICKLEIQSGESGNDMATKQFILMGKCKKSAISYVVKDMVELEAPLYP